MQTKITLDESALKWLWENAGDEFQLELKSSVVQWFGKAYLKSVVSEKVAQDAVTEVKSQVGKAETTIRTILLEELYKRFDETPQISAYESHTKNMFLPGTKLEKMMRLAANEMITKHVNLTIARLLTEEKLEKFVEELLESGIKERILEKMREVKI